MIALVMTVVFSHRIRRAPVRAGVWRERRRYHPGRARSRHRGLKHRDDVDCQWRSIEERVGGAVKAQYTWSPLDRWTLTRRKRSVSGTRADNLFVL